LLKNFNITSLHKEIEPACLMFAVRSYSSLSIRLLPGNLDEQMKILNDIWKSIVPDAKFNYVCLRRLFYSLYHKEEQQGNAIAMFSLIAFIIKLSWHVRADSAGDYK